MSDENELLDIEAAESSEGSDDDSADGDGPEFHKFGELPPELQDKIWDFYCPDLIGNRRVLHLDLLLIWDQKPSETYRGALADAPQLGFQTEAFRRFSAVNKASRERALLLAPDSLELNGTDYDAVLRFNGARDVIRICATRFLESSGVRFSSQCGANVQYAAIEHDYLGTIPHLYDHFPIAKTIYVSKDSGFDLNARGMLWCTSDYVNRYYFEWEEDMDVFTRTVEGFYCWPDMEEHAAFTKVHVRPIQHKFFPPEVAEAAAERLIDLLPMVYFKLVDGQSEYDLIKEKALFQQDLDSKSDSSSSDDDGSDEENAYESEGIDDEEIIEADFPSEDELIPQAISPGGSSSESSDEDEEAPVAHFSSPEVSEDEDRGEPVSTRRKRRIVSDSDDDEEQDSQDSDTVVTNRRKRRRIARTLASDSEGEAGDDAMASTSADGPAVSLGAAGNVSESSEEASSDDDEEDEDEQPPKSLSLAQRLRMESGTRTNAARITSESESDEDGNDGSSEDAGSSEGEDASRPRNMFFDEIASESDDDDGEASEADSFVSDG